MGQKRSHHRRFAWPPSGHQLSASFALVAESALFYGLLVRSFPEDSSLAFVLVYSLLLAAVIVCGFLTSCIDPSDKGLHRGRNSVIYSLEVVHQLRLCTLCSAYTSPASKHCRVCNRCTAGFDHHCDWLNTCIGKFNYRWFLALLFSLLGLFMLHFGVGLGLIVQILKPGGTGVEEKYQVGEGGVLFLVGVIAAEVFAMIVTIAIGGLLCFHLFLCAKSTTTYEFILQASRPKFRVSASSYTQKTQSALDKCSIESVPIEKNNAIALCADDPDCSRDISKTCGGSDQSQIEGK